MYLGKDKSLVVNLYEATPYKDLTELSIFCKAVLKTVGFEGRLEQWSSHLLIEGRPSLQDLERAWDLCLTNFIPTRPHTTQFIK